MTSNPNSQIQHILQSPVSTIFWDNTCCLVFCSRLAHTCETDRRDRKKFENCEIFATQRQASILICPILSYRDFAGNAPLQWNNVGNTLGFWTSNGLIFRSCIASVNMCTGAGARMGQSTAPTSKTSLAAHGRPTQLSIYAGLIHAIWHHVHSMWQINMDSISTGFQAILVQVVFTRENHGSTSFCYVFGANFSDLKRGAEFWNLKFFDRSWLKAFST